MRHPSIVVALVSIGACASAPTPAPASAPAPPPAAAAPATTAAPDGSPAAARLTPGTFGPGVYEPDFRHGDQRRHRSYLFFPDGRFEFRVAGYDRLPSVACTFHDAVAYGGNWRREGDAVSLRITWEDRIQGGHRAESPERGCTDEGGSFTRATLTVQRSLSLAVGVCATGFLYAEAPCVTLDGTPWYRTSPEGADPREAWYAWCADLPAAARPALCRERR